MWDENGVRRAGEAGEDVGAEVLCTLIQSANTFSSCSSPSLIWAKLSAGNRAVEEEI